MPNDVDHADVDGLKARVSVLESDAVASAAERASLRRIAERNETTLHQVLKAVEQLAASQKVVSEQAYAAMTIVKNALVLRPGESEPPTYKPTG